MAYGRVSETFWHDGKIRALSERARHFMLYLMSCPHGNRFGLFVLDPLYAAPDIQWSPDQVVDALRELRAANRIGWDEENRVVFIRHYLRHNALLNQSVVKGALKELGDIPDTPLMHDLLEALREAQVGPSGPILAHYKELEVAVSVRCRRIMPPIMQGIMPSKPAEPPETQAPPGETHNAGHNDPHNAPQAWEGKDTGSKLATPSFLPFPSRSVTSPAQSEPPPPDGGASPGRQEVESIDPRPGEQRPKHPDLDRLWTDGLRDVVLRIWHQGLDEIRLEHATVGMGLEYWLLNDLLHFAGDSDLVAWLVCEAPVELRWDTERRTLHWLLEPQNFGAGASVFYRGVRPTLQASALARPMPPPEATSDRQRVLMQQLQQLRQQEAT